MHRAAVIGFFLFPVVCLGADLFLLQSKVRTAYQEQDALLVRTSRGYDTQGNSIVRRIFDSAEETVSLKSSVSYSYDASNRCVEEVLGDFAGDTLSIVRYFYGSDGLQSAIAFHKDGSVQFRDSLLYSAGLLIELQRYGSNAMTSYHRYAYRFGLLSEDTLFESYGTDLFSPALVRVVTRNTDRSVSAEVEWKNAGCHWEPVYGSTMKYNSKKLVSVITTFSGEFADSLAYSYDAWGNRTGEESYGDDRKKRYDLVLTWLDNQLQTGAQIPSMQPTWHFSYGQRGHIEFGRLRNGTVALYTATGGKLLQFPIRQQTSIALPSGLAAGFYLLRISDDVKSIPVTISR